MGVVEDDRGGDLIVDFTNVRAISSSAIGLLVGMQKKVNEYKGRMKICCIGNKVENTASDKYVYEIFKIVKLDTYFDICANVEEALGSL